MQELFDFPSLPRCTVHMSILPVQMQRHSNPLKCVGFLFYSRLIYPAYYYTNTKIFNRQFCFKKLQNVSPCKEDKDRGTTLSLKHLSDQ